MKRKASEAFGVEDANGENKKKTRGPYLKWAIEDGKMPRSTRHSRQCSKPAQRPNVIVKGLRRRTASAEQGSPKPSQSHSKTNSLPRNQTEQEWSQGSAVQEKALTDLPDLQPGTDSIQTDNEHFEELEVLQSNNGTDRGLLGVSNERDNDISNENEEAMDEDFNSDNDTPIDEHNDFAREDYVNHGYEAGNTNEPADEWARNEDACSEDSFILRLDEDCFDTLQEPPAEEEQLDDSHSYSDDSDEEEVDSTSDLNLTTDQRIQLLLLLATKKRHNMTYTAAEDIMDFTSVLTGSEKCYKVQKHKIKSVIDSYSCDLTEHHVCRLCGKYIGIVLTSSFECTNCDSHFDTKKNKKQGHMFLYLSLKQQIEEILKECGKLIVYPNERKKICKYNYEDIYDGQFYKNIVKEGVLTLNTFIDGLQVATTSKRSAWPCLACLNELPLKMRRKFLILTCLWLSLKKPKCNEYLKPFIKECIDLARDGVTILINGQPRHFKVIVLMCICDTIARPLVRNSTQFNGNFGCGLCLHPGIELAYGRGHVRSYTTKDRVYPLRTHEGIMMHARAAEASGEPVMGIKGVSIFSKLSDFDMARCLDVDIFHALVNVAKRFANLWFLPRFSRKKFSISTKIDEATLRLMKITTTSDISRAPRPLKDRSDYRGHEWFHWVIDYSIPVLKNILPAKYLNHWSLLVHGIVLLMQNSVAKTEVEYSSRYISAFVSDIDQLYGAAHVTISVHLLTHLGASVTDFSQPWSHSAFIFESYNAEIKQAVKSSNGAAYQICKSVQLKIALKKLEREVGDKLSDTQVEYLKKMKGGEKLAKPYMTVGPAALLGKPRASPLSVESRRAIRTTGHHVPQSSILTFDRCKMHGVVYHSRNYSKVTRQDNSVVLLDSGEIFTIDSFVVVHDVCYVLGFQLELNRQRKLCEVNLPHIKVLKEPQESLKCLPVSNIEEKLLSFTIDLSPTEHVRIACINVLKMEMLR